MGCVWVWVCVILGLCFGSFDISTVSFSLSNVQLGLGLDTVSSHPLDLVSFSTSKPSCFPYRHPQDLTSTSHLSTGVFSYLQLFSLSSTTMSSNFSNPPGLPLQRAPNPINNLPDERNHPSASRAEMMPLAHSNGSDIQLAQYSIHPDALRPPQIRSKPSSSNLSRPSTSNLGHSPSKERMSVAFRDSVSNSSPPSLRDSG